MSRTTFLILLALPFVIVFFLKTPIPLHYILGAVIYIIILQALRLRYKKLSSKEIMLSYTPFGAKYWFLLWQKD